MTSNNSTKNIRLTLVFTALAFAGRSIWSQSVLATYVYLISHHRAEAVGFLSAVMGTAQLISSIPTGYFADKYGRDFLLKIASAVGLLAIGVTLAALYVPSITTELRISYMVLIPALAVWGVFWGIASTALDALFADSIPNGQRSTYFTQRSILINLGNTVGPSIALVSFFALGDEWTVNDCAIVMTLGQIICVPAVLLLAFFSDNEAIEDSTSESSLTVPLLLDESSSDISSDESSEGSVSTDAVDVLSDDDVSQNLLCKCAHRRQNRHFSPTADSNIFGCIRRKRFAPVLIGIGDLVSGLASGMSIQYFPIFFVERLRLSPVQVQILYIVTPLVQCCFMQSGQVFSQRFGRCQLTIVHRWIGIACMVLLIAMAHFESPPWIICVVYVIRTGLMNSTSPLTKSLLMDLVPAHERGRWSALESVNMFSWSGSAFVGGLLVKMDGLLFNFSATATLQFLATIPVLVVMLSSNNTEDRIDDDLAEPSSSRQSPDPESAQEQQLLQPLSSCEDDMTTCR